MSYTGKVKNGVIVLPPDVKLAEGVAVTVEPLDLVPRVSRPSKPCSSLPDRARTGLAITL